MPDRLEQWRAIEDGEPKTAWYPCENRTGDRPGWEALARRNPDKYRIETRTLVPLSTITPAEAGGLVKRLQAVTNRMTQDFDGRDDLMREAATALEAQAAELAAKNTEIANLREASIRSGDAISAERAAHAKTKREQDDLQIECTLLDQKYDRRGVELALAEAQRDEALKTLEEIGNGCDGRVDKDALPCRIARRALTGGKNG